MSVKREQTAKGLIVAAEVLGHELSPLAAGAMARELAGYPEQEIATALRRCIRELRGRLTLADVLQRLPGQHPGAEEAWALCPRSESQTVVWTDQVAEAYGVASPLVAEGDNVAARMAFREAYTRLVAEADGPPAWRVSLGHDVHGREAPIRAAVDAGRLLAEHAEPHLAGLPSSVAARDALPAPQSIAGLLAEACE